MAGDDDAWIKVGLETIPRNDVGFWVKVCRGLNLTNRNEKVLALVVNLLDFLNLRFFQLQSVYS